ncbi:MAG: MFS transporter, partial [Alphaproteobacteria bacterium]|nr:MFS transporter [Alphaproteobacteria bacterium]
MTDPPPDPTARRRNPWRLRLGILTLAHVVGTLHSTTVLVMAPAIKDDLGLTFAEFGLLVTAYSTGQVTGALPAGNLTDRVGVGWALVVAHGILIVSALTLIQATGLSLALIAMLIAGWGYSIINPATAKGVFEAFPASRRATAMGVKQTGVPIGGVVAAAGGSLITVVAWQTVTLGVAIVTVLGALACLPIVERPKPRPKPAQGKRFAGFGEILRDANFSRFVGANFLYNFGQYNFFSYLTLFMRDVAMLSQELAGLCYGVAQMTSVTARLGWGAVSDFLFTGRR